MAQDDLQRGIRIGMAVMRAYIADYFDQRFPAYAILIRELPDPRYDPVTACSRKPDGALLHGETLVIGADTTPDDEPEVTMYDASFTPILALIRRETEPEDR